MYSHCLDFLEKIDFLSVLTLNHAKIIENYSDLDVGRYLQLHVCEGSNSEKSVDCNQSLWIYMRNPLILFLLGILYSCHTQDQYRSVINFISSADDFCSEAQDFNSCQSLVDRCQPAFDESQNFAACVANPSEWSDTDDPEVSPRDETNPPSIGETLEVKCQISGKYLLNYSAVKLCHNNQTIVVSCNELSVHQKHQVAGDYIGACHQ